MKERWKNTAFFAQVMVLCLCLAACGNSDDVAGDDWRTTGMVVDSGTITHDGDSVDVLVTVSESSAAFYRDIPVEGTVRQCRLPHGHSRCGAGISQHLL